MTTYQEKQSWERWTRWGQLGNPSSHWTIGLANQWFGLAIVLFTLFHFVLASRLPLSEDEIYFWSWSRRLSLSYFDHPPMVAYFIRLSTAVLGNGPGGIRFFAVVGSSLVLWLVGRLCGRKDVVGFLLFSPVFFFGAALMTPDIPLLIFWTLYMLWFIACNQKLSQWGDDPVTRVYQKMPVGYWYWILGGVLLGLGVLSKYTMVIATPCVLFALISKYRLKGWLRGFLVHLVVGSIVSSGILIYNVRYGFAPFKFQLGRNVLAGAGDLKYNLLSFFGSQILLVGLLPLVCLPAILFRWKEWPRDPKLHACVYFFLVPFLFFVAESFQTFLEANWALIAYVGFWPLAQEILPHGVFRRVSTRSVLILFCLPLVATLLMAIHLVSPLKFIAPDRDRVRRISAQNLTLKRAANEIRHFVPTPVVYGSSYAITSSLEHNGIPALQLHPYNRPSEYTLRPTAPCGFSEVLLLVTLESDPPSALDCFPHSSVLAKYPLLVRGADVGGFELRRYWR